MKKRGGKRKGAGRKSMGKERYTVTLTPTNVSTAKEKERNLSGLLDRLLAQWYPNVKRKREKTPTNGTEDVIEKQQE